jgi:hypothetical protein
MEQMRDEITWALPGDFHFQASMLY